MILTTLLLVAGLAAAALLLRRVLGGGERYERIPRGPGRRDSAQDVYWEARVLAALNGNRAALERQVVGKQRHKPGLKRWELLRLVYLDLTRRGAARPTERPAAGRRPSGRRTGARGGTFRTHF
ncbi:hypothetical protein [Deinococcus soli (ex Cha et al. 2016)]|uniref:Uncharacterized protein n=2 Tax=Deinococcus soli (ex Cha et al. 2016) TaxID=1309411 RepID=A0A0F7JPI2_9DEIO|nr:hypothetical protein [Deinococcus soli (ex Cha et al. 2016)]AKH17652.1 hypothetical protein SY84_12110 [Deinococcus soli (ex Cha et al. 2016)]MDR6220757.1 hypothetical protein [Deinococcus soli (ex Cha et al. 2016)]MDR6330716.1 hypothetical protein [Deinococcus soli (ex Cha et al. 2016)]MDR6753758.1 hypothetical protein [Deinococcus soli (ex Cha et al. 2016)]GGB58258.1 hypothetical protein GCM10008019_12690 [Deinococcus soli (ex Cha et al. 2016)]